VQKDGLAGLFGHTYGAESFLLGDEVKLYLREDEWHYVHERECEFRRERRRSCMCEQNSAEKAAATGGGVDQKVF
jgi:hypothetical protein